MEVNTTATINPVNMYYPTSWDLNNFAINPIIFFIILIVFIIYFVLFYSLGNNSSNDSIIGSSSDNNGQTTKIISVLVVGILIVLILINLFQYFFNISATAYLSNIFTDKPEVNVVVDQHGSQGLDYQPAPVPEIKFKKQVFNIPGNYYNYEDAKALCKAYGADLANYKQIEDAYKNGAEWCNYGWSDGQMILFPTQQNTFDNLQKIEGHQHDCGRPGINGGYIANPNIKYGVNCYGNKPKITSEEEELMKISSPYPKTQKDIDFQKKVDYWQNKVDQILVSPFNYDSWSS